MTPYLSGPDRRAETDRAEDRLFPLEPFPVPDDFPGRPETCPVCRSTERQHAPGVWDAHQDLWERRARHARVVEAGDMRRLCRTCGQVHGTGACP